MQNLSALSLPHRTQTPAVRDKAQREVFLKGCFLDNTLIGTVLLETSLQQHIPKKWIRPHSFCLLIALDYCSTGVSSGAERWNISRQITIPFFCTACQLQSRSGQDAPEVCSSSKSSPWRICPMKRTNICQHQCSDRGDNAALALHVIFSLWFWPGLGCHVTLDALFEG